MSNKIIRRKTRSVNAGGVIIGGEAPIWIQSMTNTRTDNIDATVEQVNSIYEAGGELVRVAVPDEDALRALPSIIHNSPVPIIADIHFRSDLALGSIGMGVAKLRINPGNIGGPEKLREIAAAAALKDIPIRIGVNAGSLQKEIFKRFGEASPEALVESALIYIRLLEDIGFTNIIISLKASNVTTTYLAYSLMADKVDYPFHIGVTEAGPLYRGTVKSAVGIGSLLLNGLGDTVRVSLSDDPVKEIKAAQLILQASGVRAFGPDIISCPTCGRCHLDILELSAGVEKIINKMGITKPYKIAIMGCEVNGPGEAKDACLGLAGSGKHGIIFRRGKIVRRVVLKELMHAFSEELEKLNKEEIYY